MASINKIGKHQTKHIVIDGIVTVTYWDTVVFKYDTTKGIITLDTGYYETKTTKLRMNQCLYAYGLSLRVFTKKGILKIINYITNEEYEFTKKITFKIDYDNNNNNKIEFFDHIHTNG